MPEVIDCPSCSRKLRVPEALLGSRVKCPTCGETFTAPERQAQEPAATPKPRGPRRAADDDEEEPCPYCGELVSLRAARCPYCEEDLEEEERPWERYGALRRDCESHRGPLVLTLGILSVVTSVALVCCPLLALGGLPLGITAWVMGSRDLQKMRAGVMDRQGRGQTHAGMVCGIIGTALGCLCGLGMAAWIAFNLMRHP